MYCTATDAQIYISIALISLTILCLSLVQVCGSDSLCICRKDITVSDHALRNMEETAYREHYFGVQHWNYFTEEPDIGPIILSLKQEPCGEKFRLEMNKRMSGYCFLIDPDFRRVVKESSAALS